LQAKFPAAIAVFCLVAGQASAQVISEPPLPGGAEGSAGVLDSPNPLLFFDPDGRPPEAQMSRASQDDLTPLSLFAPGEPGAPPEPPPAGSLTPAQEKLVALARRVAASVVSIRVWDEFGGLLSRGAGCFVTGKGWILTDTSVVHPEIAARIDYVTVTAANGETHRVTGYYRADLTTGVTLLQSDAPDVPPLELVAEADFSSPQPCRVVAVSDSRGLLIADATVEMDQTLAGQGWLTLQGDDSPGAPGSPVLDSEGRVLGIVAMETPLKDWMNFAVPAGFAAYEINRKPPPLRPLRDLPKHPKVADVAADPLFVTAFEQLEARRSAIAVRNLLRLTRRYPRSAECWALLGLGASLLDATPDALACQRRAVALDPRSGLYWHRLAVAQIRERGATGAARELGAQDLEALRRATEESPNDRVSWLLLSSHHLLTGDSAAAAEALRRLTFLAPGYSRGFYLLGIARARLGDLGGAADAVSRSLQLDSTQPDAWFLLGLLRTRTGEDRLAVEAFKKVTRLNPDHPHAWQNLAFALKRSGRSAEAGNAYRQHRERVLAGGQRP
jgi:tetratricopeptide (TPR) repeat protein/S1-C subfamily serine protease